MKEGENMGISEIPTMAFVRAMEGFICEQVDKIKYESLMIIRLVHKSRASGFKALEDETGIPHADLKERLEFLISKGVLWIPSDCEESNRLDLVNLSFEFIKSLEEEKEKIHQEESKSFLK